jgi:hypothetical protein
MEILGKFSFQPFGRQEQGRDSYTIDFLRFTFRRKNNIRTDSMENFLGRLEL